MAGKRKISINDFLHKKFGKLLVVKSLPDEGYKRYVECLCDCGNVTKVYLYHLQNNHTQSCGCFHKEKARDIIKHTIAVKLPDGESPKHSIYGKYVSSAQKREIPFRLSKQEFLDLIKKDCFYCGESPSRIFQNRRFKNDIYTYNGVDRKDNSKGYEINNCVPCCTFCNFAKGAFNSDYFLLKIKQIYDKNYGNQ